MRLDWLRVRLALAVDCVLNQQGKLAVFRNREQWKRSYRRLNIESTAIAKQYLPSPDRQRVGSELRSRKLSRLALYFPRQHTS